jgi:hypothetical protein
MDPELEELYFLWLCNKIERLEVPTPSLTHWNLLKELHRTEFVWLVDWDDNRANDGVALRSRFFVELGRDEEEAEQYRYIPCSVLEMLIAFCERIPEVVTEHLTPKEWFWELIRNLHLEEQHDAGFNEDTVKFILDKFIWRTYSASGVGSLFPLFEPTRPVYDVELWYQLFDYVKDRRRNPEWHRTT